MKIIKNTLIKRKHHKPILVDVFYKENHQPKKILIFCHGYKGFKDWGAWNLLAEEFANRGYFFIKFNFSHNGSTAENPIDFPDLEAFGNNNYSKELDDLEGVLDWVFSEEKFKNELNINDISLIGHSRGGGIVLLKANEDSRIKKVITLASVSDFKKRFPKDVAFKEWREKGVYYVKNGRTQQEMPHFFQFYKDFIENENRLDIKKAVKNLKIPHLIIHGNRDTSVSIKEAENLKQWNPQAKFEIVENANHVFNTSHPWNKKQMSLELKQVCDLVINFLN